MDAESSEKISNGASYLEHAGVKGMRWGVRKDRSGSSANSPKRVQVKEKPGRGVVKTSGGKKLDASTDAKQKAKLKQKAKASTTDSLSNEELKKLVTRMQLEQQYSKLSSQTQKKSKGKEFIKGVLKNESDSLAKGRPGPITAAIISAVGVAFAARAGASAGYNSAARNAGKSSARVIKGTVLSESTKIIKR